jgi:hypothetical protein
MRVRLQATLSDGRRFEAEDLYAPLSDRVAFERQFGVTAAVLSRLTDAFDKDGKLNPDTDATQIREEHVAFLSWRLLRRTAELGTFDEFIDLAEELDIEALPDGADTTDDEVAAPPFSTETAPPT